MPTGGADILVAAGVDAATAASVASTVGGIASTVGGIASTVGEGALAGGAIGGLEGAVTGGNVGQDVLHGAEAGAITGGGIGIGGDIASGLGATAGSLGATAGNVLGGAAGGSLGSEVTGGKPLTGALQGAASGGLASILNANSGSTGLAPSDSNSISTSPSSSGAQQTSNIASTPSGGANVGAAGGGASAISAPAGVSGSGPDLTAGSDVAAQTPTGNTFAPVDNSGSGVTPSTPTSSGGPLGFLKSVFGGGSQSGTMSDQNFNNFINQAATAPSSSASLTGEPAGTSLSPGVQSADAAAQIPSGQTGAVSGGGGAASSTPSAGSQFVKSLFNGQSGTTLPAFDNLLSSNANLAVPAAVIGYDAIESGKTPKGFNQLQSEAGQDMQQGQQLESYLQNGTLPPGLAGAVAQNLAATQAAIKSRYAAINMSGSSAEQQDLMNAATQSQADSAQLAMGLLSQGISETGQSSGIYENLIKDISSELNQYF